MGAVTYVQTLKLLAGATPATGQVIIDKDFSVDPALTQTFADINEDEAIRFNIASGTTNSPISLGTVALGKIFVITPDEDLNITIINGDSAAPLLFRGGITSILHTEFTGLLVSNNSGISITGKLFLAGD